MRYTYYALHNNGYFSYINAWYLYNLCQKTVNLGMFEGESYSDRIHKKPSAK